MPAPILRGDVVLDLGDDEAAASFGRGGAWQVCERVRTAPGPTRHRVLHPRILCADARTSDDRPSISRVHRAARTRRGLLAVLLGLAAAAAGTAGTDTTASAAARPPSCTAAHPVTVTPDRTLDDLFNTYGNAGRGRTWTGGDGTESVALPNGRELWLFADTFLGTVHEGRRALDLSPYLHNSLVVENHGVLGATLYTSRPGRPPVAYVNPVPSRPFVFAFWPGPAVVNGHTLQVIGGEERFRNDGTFSYLGNALATFSLPGLRLLSLRALPLMPVDWVHGHLGVLTLSLRPDPLVDWAAGAMEDGGFTYIYGKSAHDMYVARVHGTNLSTSWSFYDGQGWTSDANAVAPIEHIETLLHLSVTKVAGSYVFVASPTPAPDTIEAAFGCSPVGPFGPSQTIYTTPEVTRYPVADGVITYGAHAHPELDPDANTLLVSYDVNPKAAQGIASPDASIYRPRFIDVHVG